MQTRFNIDAMVNERQKISPKRFKHVWHKTKLCADDNILQHNSMYLNNFKNSKVLLTDQIHPTELSSVQSFFIFNLSSIFIFPYGSANFCPILLIAIQAHSFTLQWYIPILRDFKHGKFDDWRFFMFAKRKM